MAKYLAPIIWQADSVIDGDGERLPQGTAVRTEGWRIVRVGPEASLDPGSAETRRFPGATMLPGLIDCHAYLSVDPARPDPMGGMHGDPVERAFTAARHLAIDLASGVTTMRVMGEGGGLDYRARGAIRQGRLDGPDLLCSGAPVCPSTSHQAAPTGGADGVEAVRAAVRREIASGADWIKLVVTGGVNAPGDRATTALYSEPEIAVAMEEAARGGLPVAVAAHGGPSVRQCLRLGARTVEHCAFFEDDALAAVAEHGATLVLTLSRFFRPDGIELSGRGLPGVPEKLARARESLAALVPKAVARGTRIALGADNMHGLLADDARFFASMGASNAAAIAAVTGGAAETIGVGLDRGRIAAGHRADFVIVEGDPLADIAALSRVRAVVQGGVVRGAR